MSDYPILFSTNMVNAIRSGLKSQTRRIVSPQPSCAEIFAPTASCEQWYFRDGYYACPENDIGNYVSCPFGKPGDRLWVKETWCAATHPTTGMLQWNEDGNTYKVLYKADGADVCAVDDDGHQKYTKAGREASPWQASLHMPRWASRLLLENRLVRVQRLQDITLEEILHEGIHVPMEQGDFRTGERILSGGEWSDACRGMFAQLWDSLHAQPKPIHERVKGKKTISHYVSHPFAGEKRTETFRGKPHHIIPNPYVWAIEFQELQRC